MEHVRSKVILIVGEEGVCSKILEGKAAVELIEGVIVANVL